MIEIMGTRTATVQRVESVRKGVVRLVDSSITYSATSLEEIDPVIPGCRSYLSHLDGGEAERWSFKEKF